MRHFSRQLGVNTATVNRAYWKLENEGLLECRPQSGFFVKSAASHYPLELKSQPTTAPIPGIHTMALDKKTMGEVTLFFGHKDITLGTPFPHVSTIPAELGRCLDRARKNMDPQLYCFPLPNGVKEIRVQLARHHLNMGLNFSPDDFVITSGGMESLFLSFLSVVNPGDVVAVSSPYFLGISMLLNNLRVKIVNIPSDPQTGMDLDVLRKVLKKHDIKACYAMPNFSNPIGCSMPDENKKALVEMLSAKDIPLIENDTYSDIYFGEVRPKPAKAYDKRGLVMLCSSFSKTVSMGVKLGWVLPGQRFTECIGFKVLPHNTSQPLVEKAYADFLSLGSYERHLRKLRKLYGDNLKHFQKTIAAHFPEGTQTSRPEGGLSMWLKLPPKVDVMRLYQEAAAINLYLVAGFAFSVGADYSDCLQLCFAEPWSEKVEKKLQTVGNLAKKQLVEKK